MNGCIPAPPLKEQTAVPRHLTEHPEHPGLRSSHERCLWFLWYWRSAPGHTSRSVRVPRLRFSKPDRRSLRLMWMMRMMRVRTTKWGLPTPIPTGATRQRPRLRRAAMPARWTVHPVVPLRLTRALGGSPLHIPAHRVLPAFPMVRPPANRGLPAGRDRAHRVSRLYPRRPRLRSA